MPAIHYKNDDDDKQASGYENTCAAYWTVTEEGLEAARAVRREAGADITFWNGMKSEVGRFAKEQQKLAQRTEKAATIWLRHFEEVGKKSIRKMPSELHSELDLVFGRMFLA